MNWAEQRARFPVLAAARLSELRLGRAAGPRDARRDGDAAGLGGRERPRAGAPYFEEMLARRDRVRAQVAEQVAVPADRIALTSSTTQGVQIVVVGLGLGPGDEVVTTDVEHFGLTGPLLGARADLRIAQVRERPAAELFDLVRAQVTPRTRLIALSAVSWLDGKVFPWRELREATGVPVLVDGAQSVGRDRGRRDRGGLLHDQRPEVAVRAGRLRRAVHPRSRSRCSTGSSSYPSAASYDIAAGTWEPKPGAAGFDPGFAPPTSLAGLEAALTGQPAGRFERARRARRPLRRPAARGRADGGERARPEHARLVPRARQPDRDRGRAATSRACSSASSRTPTTSARRSAGGTTRATSSASSPGSRRRGATPGRARPAIGCSAATTFAMCSSSSTPSSSAPW